MKRLVVVALLIPLGACRSACGTHSGTGGLDARPGDVAVARARLDEIRFAVIGDYGAGTPESERVAALVRGFQPDFIITTGDNNYPLGAAATIDGNIGRHYHAFIGAYRGAHGRPSGPNRFWPCPGNHDWEAADLRPYLDYFTLPGNERYYDVDLGLVHLFALDSDAREPDGVSAESAQAAWLKPRLASSRSCFDLVTLHHPPYSSGRHGSTRETRWPFAAWGADAVLAGHDHIYERLDVDQIPYFVNGLGGASLYLLKDALPESRFRYAERHGAMLVVATRAGITFEFWNVDGTMIDRHVVAKACP